MKLNRPITLLTPGPTFVHPEILRRSAKKMISHRSKEFRELFSQFLEKLKKSVFTEQHVVVLSGSCTLGVEAMIWSLIKPGDKVLVLKFGEFGRRLEESARRRGAIVDVVEAERGAAPEPDAIEDKLAGHKAVITVFTETSTGAKLRDLRKIAEIVKRAGSLFMVDASSAYAGEVIKFDEFCIDALVACTQKALGSTPGLSFVFLSEDAVKNLTSEGVPTYMDLCKYLKFHEEKSETPFTPAMSVLYAADAALDMLLEEGVENRAKRLSELRDWLYERASRIGLNPFPKKEYWSNTVAAIEVSNAVRVKEELESHGILVATGIGDLRDKIIRVGIMGWVAKKDLERLIAGLKSILGGEETF